VGLVLRLVDMSAWWRVRVWCRVGVYLYLYSPSVSIYIVSVSIYIVRV